MKKFFEEFKKFITRGNVLDMAVGVIIGGAFTSIVNGLTNNVLKPVINWIIALVIGDGGLEGAVTVLSPKPMLDASGNVMYDAAGKEIIDLANSIYIDWGALVSAIINFLLIAIVLFVIIKVMNSINSGWADIKKEAKEMTSKEVLELRKQGKKKKEIKKILKERKLKLEEEKKLKAEEEKKNAPPTTEQLLTMILEELKTKK